MITRKEILEGIVGGMVSAIHRNGVTKEEAVTIFFDSLTAEEILEICNNDQEMVGEFCQLAVDFGYSRAKELKID